MKQTHRSSLKAYLRMPFFILCIMLALATAISVTAQDNAPTSINIESSLEGVLMINHGDPKPESSVPYQVYAVLYTADGPVQLVGAEPVTWQVFHGERVRVTGTPAAPLTAMFEQALSVDTLQIIETIDGGPGSPAAFDGTWRWINVLCRFSDYANVTPEEPAYFLDLMGNTYPRMGDYWPEISYGSNTTDAANVAGWYTLDNPRSTYINDTTGTFNLSELAQDCAAKADPDVNFLEYDAINVHYNTDANSAWGGGTVINAEGTSIIMRSTWMPTWGYRSLGVMAHEMGHGYGWPHSSGGYGETYNSNWDVMSGAFACDQFAFDDFLGCLQNGTIGYHLASNNWLPLNRAVVAFTGQKPQTFLLNPLSEADSTSDILYAEVRINDSASNFYTVEARSFAGPYDQNIPDEGVLIHEVRTNRTTPAIVVDATNNANPNDDGAMWLPGETFNPTGTDIYITVLAQTGTSYVVRLDNASGILTPDLVYQEDYYAFAYSGTWQTIAQSDASGGALQRTTDANASVTFTTDGASTINITRTIGPNYGDMQVCVDGNCQTISNDSGSIQYAQLVTVPLGDNGQHTVVIRNTANSTLEFDAVDFFQTVEITANNSNELIAAINAANVDGARNIINLVNGTTYTISNNGASDLDAVQSALPAILNDGFASAITINGNDATIERSGIGNAPLFDIQSGAELTLKDLTLIRAQEDEDEDDNLGRAINNAGTLTLQGVTINGFESESDGGAIYNVGNFSALDSTITANSATNGGGIYSARNMELTNVTISSNNASGDGGGIWISGELILNSVNVLSNRATNGGGIATKSNTAPLTIDNSTFISNLATGNGGAIHNAFAITQTISNTIFSTNGTSGAGGAHYSVGNVTLNGNTYSDNSAQTIGGAIQSNTGSLNATDTVFERNSGGTGGALYISNNLTLTRVTVKQNLATVAGGGVVAQGITTLRHTTVEGNSTTGSGGGILAENNLTVENSAFVGNQSLNGSGIYAMSNTSLVNSTIGGNASTSGGGLYIEANGSASLKSVTIAYNTGNGAGIYAQNGATVDVVNTLITGGSGLCVGPITSLGHNLFGQNNDPAGCPAGGTDIVPSGDINTIIEPVAADNGGNTLTYALVANSPAIDAANNSVIIPSDYPTGDDIFFDDQRGDGFWRLMDVPGIGQDGVEIADIGAFEVQGVGGCPAFPATTSNLTQLSFYIQCANYTEGQATITLAADALYSITAPFDSNAALPTIIGDVRIEGQGATLDLSNTVGRAFYINAGGTLELHNFTISGGDTNSSGGAVSVQNGSLIAHNMTFTGNESGFWGGAIHVNTGSTATLTNTTISGNTGRFGGGIALSGNITLNHVTITGNHSEQSGGGLYLLSGASATVGNSIISGNTRQFDFEANDCAGFIISNGYNVFGYNGSSDGCTASSDDVVPGGALNTVLNTTLATNGGDTATHALVSGSAAIDLVPVIACSIATDQRGVARPLGAACDAGAFEFGNSPYDIDSDGVVTPLDVIYVINRLGESGGLADVNNSGLVDATDVQAILNRLGTPGL